MYLPESIEPDTSTGKGCGAFRNALVNHFVDLEQVARVQYGNILCKD